MSLKKAFEFELTGSTREVPSNHLYTQGLKQLTWKEISSIPSIRLSIIVMTNRLSSISDSGGDLKSSTEKNGSSEIRKIEDLII